MEENIGDINSIGKGASIDDTLRCSNSIFAMFYELKGHWEAANQLFELLFDSTVNPDEAFELAETYYSEKENNEWF